MAEEVFPFSPYNLICYRAYWVGTFRVLLVAFKNIRNNGKLRRLIKSFSL